MLCAEEVALQARLVQQLATVRKTELDYLLARFQSVGTQAALVCGFTMSSLTQLSATDPDPKASMLTVHAFYFTSFVGLLAGQSLAGQLPVSVCVPAACFASLAFVMMFGHVRKLLNPSSSYYT